MCRRDQGWVCPRCDIVCSPAALFCDNCKPDDGGAGVPRPVNDPRSPILPKQIQKAMRDMDPKQYERERMGTFMPSESGDECQH